MRLRYIENVVTLKLDRDKCIGCGRCLEVCPHGIFSLAERKARIEDRDLCIECGACQQNCPVSAISVRAGVGCASAIIKGKLNGTEPNCDCSDNSCC
jgi:ferredoxin